MMITPATKPPAGDRHHHREARLCNVHYIIEGTATMIDRPDQCPQFDACDAPWCPADPGLNKRVWIIGESVCRSRSFTRTWWIKRQRSINKRMSPSLVGRAFSHQEFIETYKPRSPRPTTDEQRQVLRDRVAHARSIRRINSKAGQTAVM
ncbi:MAG: hypothetical protein HQK58_06830 [Deltaproteobacteria bacterium]|nr:hypothetical protein [Deltaproteobacteria bacterium]